MILSEKKTRIQKAVYCMEQVDSVAVFFVGMALMFMTFLITIDVVLRFLLNSPLPNSMEISELAMAYIIFLPLGYALSKGMHIRITALFEFIPTRAKVFFDFIADFAGLVFCGVMTYFSWEFFLHSFSIREEMLAVIKLPWYVGKFAMPVGFLLFMLQFLINLITDLGGFSER